MDGASMDDPFDRLNEQEIADACAFADGTLPHERRAEVEARVLASPELTALVARQRRSLAATGALCCEQAPESLALALRGLRPRRVRPERRRRRRLGFALSAAGGLAAVLVVFGVLSLGGGTGGPSVAAAAHFALQPPSSAAPAVVSGTGRLDAAVGGISFPDYSVARGWRAVGSRSGTVQGRPVTVVYYEKNGRRAGYAIVDGAALPRPDGARTTLSGVEFRSLTRQGQQIVTWRSHGHTCVLVGPVSAADLLALASTRVY